MKKFEWLPGACAPKNYPIDSYKAGYIFEDDTSIYIPIHMGMAGGWGTEGPTDVVGEAFKSIPVRLELYWMSFAEKKWYKGSWTLPQEKMMTLFEKGFIDQNTNKKDNYTKIVTGLAPGGVVVVWLSGAGYKIEVDRFQAEQTTWPLMAQLMPGNPILSKEDYLKLDSDVEAHLEENSIPFGLWDGYRTRYNWHPKINMLDAGAKLKVFAPQYYNGEFESWVIDYMEGWETRAIPKECVLYWETGNYEYVTTIKLDEVTIFKTFKEVFGEDNNQRADFTVTIENRKVKEVFLQIGDTKTKVTPEEIKQYKYEKKS